MVLNKTKLAVLILGLVAGAIGVCIGYGIIRIPQPKLVFDLMFLLTMIYIFIWTIRKRHENERRTSEGSKVPRVGINVFERFRLWLSGTFKCRKCGLRVHLMAFGYGETICPDCYEGEEKFIFFDESYWLNRLLSRMQKE